MEGKRGDRSRARGKRSKPMGRGKEVRHDRSIGTDGGFPGRIHNWHQLKWLVRDGTVTGGK